MQKCVWAVAMICLVGVGCASETYQPVPEPGGFVHETPNQMKDDSSSGQAVTNPISGTSDAYAAKRAIQGHCDIEDQGTLMPCPALLFKVIDQRKQIVSDMRIGEKGNFVFYVQYEQGYHLRIQSKDYVAHYQPAGWIHPGGFVQIRVTPKKKSSMAPSS